MYIIFFRSILCLYLFHVFFLFRVSLSVPFVSFLFPFPSLLLSSGRNFPPRSITARIVACKATLFGAKMRKNKLCAFYISICLLYSSYYNLYNIYIYVCVCLHVCIVLSSPSDFLIVFFFLSTFLSFPFPFIFLPFPFPLFFLSFPIFRSFSSYAVQLPAAQLHGGHHRTAQLTAAKSRFVKKSSFLHILFSLLFSTL